MLCPLCTRKNARRACPALGRDICAVCCGTKRLTEIQCPPDCVYLASSRQHPPAAVVRRHERDLGWLIEHMRDLGERQSRLFFLVASFLARYEAGELQQPLDADAAEALGALASTLETSVRGVIYEHHATSVPAEQLLAALTPLLTEAGKGGGTPFERDAAVVLRRLEAAARDLGRDAGGQPRALFELLRRVITQPVPGEAPPEGPVSPEPPRLILP